MNSLISYINESLEVVYHYMSINDLLSVIEDDTFYVADDDGHNSKSRKGYNYLSTTRQKNALTEYPTGLISDKIVRLTLDYDKLRAKYKAEPVDRSKAKTRAIRNSWINKDDFDRYEKDIMLQTNVENEERFYVNNYYIRDFYKYIKGVDIIINQCTKEEFNAIRRYCDFYKIRLKKYDNKRDFDLGR